MQTYGDRISVRFGNSWEASVAGAQRFLISHPQEFAEGIFKAGGQTSLRLPVSTDRLWSAKYSCPILQGNAACYATWHAVFVHMPRSVAPDNPLIEGLDGADLLVLKKRRSRSQGSDSD